jgi:hypothetical protein
VQVRSLGLKCNVQTSPPPLGNPTPVGFVWQQNPAKDTPMTPGETVTVLVVPKTNPTPTIPTPNPTDTDGDGQPDG